MLFVERQSRRLWYIFQGGATFLSHALYSRKGLLFWQNSWQGKGSAASSRPLSSSTAVLSLLLQFNFSDLFIKTKGHFRLIYSRLPGLRYQLSVLTLVKDQMPAVPCETTIVATSFQAALPACKPLYRVS